MLIQNQQPSQLGNINRSLTTNNDNSIRSASLVVDVLQQRRLNSSSTSNCGILAKNGVANGRLPKLMSHEIVLDKLEVNWSVPHIRSVFQQNRDVKPPNIDTLYARVA